MHEFISTAIILLYKIDDITSKILSSVFFEILNL